jgi:glycosyltransferase involved in cell wall biosynthesis
MKNNSVQVSIITITYNQEEYIEKTILSVLNQHVDFEYEYIISDDSTNDKTSIIVNKILSEHKYAYRINYYRNNPRLGAWSNFLTTIKKASGKYIALCEGDDYWIDDVKLQFQYNFLEKNSSHVLIMNEICYDINGSIKKIKENKYLDKIGYDYCSYFKIQFSQTSSFFFKNIISFPNDVINYYAGDFILVALCSMHGKMFYDKNVRSAYRVNANNSMTKTNKFKKLMFYKNQASVNNYLLNKIGVRYPNCLRTNIFKLIFYKLSYILLQKAYNLKK